MNSHHQPQNNPHNPQNNVYLQQSGPNKYPTLPPIQNHQNVQYSPQQPQYPGYNAQARPGGYLPPAEYGNIQAQANHEHERQEVLDNMEENDKKFDSCFIKFYQAWLWLQGIACIAGAFCLFISYLKAESNNGPLAFLAFNILALIFFQSVYGLKAISQRNIKKAAVTCWLTTLFLISSLLVDIWLILTLWLYSYPRPPPNDEWSHIIKFLIGVVSTQILIHVAISMNGAFKVKKILSEREILKEKLNEIDYSFKA